MGETAPPDGVAGVMVIGEVVRVREALADASAALIDDEAGNNEVKYGRNR